ncbi:MAG: prepilin-type N-terminal cleavage/methylation domain-containing protein [Patescibacteria group bacterium]
MKRKKYGFTLIELVIAISALAIIAGCGGGGGGSSLNLPEINYTPISGVPQPVNDLGKMICQEQRSVVTPGGNQWAPGFSWLDKTNFDESNQLQEIVAEVKGSSVFSNGVASIRTLSTNDQSRVLTAYSKPLYPTWAMNGYIGSDGTTDAGYAVEQQIATALTNAVEAAL